MTGVGDSIEADLGAWTFSDGVESKFDEHVKKSVIGYDLSQKIITLLSDNFVHNCSTIIDLGCSTGSLTRSIYKRHQHKDINIIGYDLEQGMIDKAISLSKKEGIEIDYQKANIIDVEFPSNVDMIISAYTIQFVLPRTRQLLINKIYETLDWGGGFFLFEKVRAPDARFQDYINQAYMNFKLVNFSPDEIIKKSNSLSGVMEPFSSEGNLGLLKRAGFTDICTVAKYLCFEGFLAIK
tara:strand:+ start:5414 stop:6127 length:714 start_codon:yes stop_codon:yes gene_type:complete